MPAMAPPEIPLLPLWPLPLLLLSVPGFRIEGLEFRV